MTVSTSFRLSDEVHVALSSLAERYGISRTAVLELLILDRASVSDLSSNMQRRNKARDHALSRTNSGRALFVWGYNSGWIDFQTRHGDNPMIETLPENVLNND